MNRISAPPLDSAPLQQPARRGILGRILLHCALLLFAAVAFVGYEHFKLNGQSTPALVSLIAAGVLAVAPVRALLGEVFAIEGKALHALHGIGGLAFVGLAAGGAISGQPLLTHAAMAPFAIMGAAQAIVHQDHPRNAQQAEALRRFASSLPEVAAFARPGDLTAPANAARAVDVLNDLSSRRPKRSVRPSSRPIRISRAPGLERPRAPALHSGWTPSTRRSIDWPPIPPRPLPCPICGAGSPKRAPWPKKAASVDGASIGSESRLRAAAHPGALP